MEQADGTVLTRCHSRGMEPVIVRTTVVRCNDYDDRRTPSEYEMQKIAWVVTTDRSGQTIGFKPPQKKADD